MRRRLFLGSLGTLLVGSQGHVTGQRGRGRGGQAAPGRPPAAAGPREQRVLDVLERMRTQRETYLSVPPDDGRWLRVLAESTGARQVVEVGTSTGYSGLWLALALIATDGRLTTLEIDEGRAAEARKHFEQAGVADRITVTVGDAHESVRSIAGPVDLVFLDADKEGYRHYFTTLAPHLRPGGLVLAHNVSMIGDYLDAVQSDPAFETVYYMGGGGLAVTLKKRPA